MAAGEEGQVIGVKTIASWLNGRGHLAGPHVSQPAVSKRSCSRHRVRRPQADRRAALHEKQSGPSDFPYNSTFVRAAFTRACRSMKIEDLDVHDLLHEATSRLFDFGFQILQVALVTGRKEWKMRRRRHTEALHELAAARTG